MIRNASLGAGIFGLLVLIAASDINARYWPVVVVAAAITLVFLSLAGGAMNEQQDSIKAITPLGTAEVSGPNLFARSASSALVTNILLGLLLIGLYMHDGITTDIQKRQTAAIETANYLSTQPEEVRMAIGKRMQVPDALRRQMIP